MLLPKSNKRHPLLLPRSQLLLLLLLPEPSSPDPPELSPEVDTSGDAATCSRSSFSLSCTSKCMRIDELVI
jgi:hypothetical protein